MAKTYDLEQRCYEFARDVRVFIRRSKLDIPNSEDSRQLTRSSGAVGANYIEGNEGLSKKDSLKYFRISRKEAKESGYWLRLIETFNDSSLQNERDKLVGESQN